MRDYERIASEQQVTVSRMLRLARLLRAIDVPDYRSNLAELAEEIDALAGGIEALAERCLRENEV